MQNLQSLANTSNLGKGSKANAPAVVSNYSLSFNGTTDYVSINSQLFYQNAGYTVSFWINFTDIGVGRRLISLGNSLSNTQVWLIEADPANNGALGFLIRNDANSTRLATSVISTTTGVNSGTWRHICITDNAGALILYIDGVADATNFTYTPSGVFTIDRTGIAALVRTTVTSFVLGLMDDVRIWNNTVLTAPQVSSLFSAGTNPSAPTSWYKFDEGSGTTALDSGSNGTNATITGATYSSNVHS